MEQIQINLGTESHFLQFLFDEYFEHLNTLLNNYTKKGVVELLCGLEIGFVLKRKILKLSVYQSESEINNEKKKFFSNKKFLILLTAICLILQCVQFNSPRNHTNSNRLHFIRFIVNGEKDFFILGTDHFRNNFD